MILASHRQYVKLLLQNMAVLLWTVFVLVVSVSLLSTISSRQSALSNAENAIIDLEKTLAQKAVGQTLTVSYPRPPVSSGHEAEKHQRLSERISQIKYIIAFGERYSVTLSNEPYDASNPHKFTLSAIINYRAFAYLPSDTLLGMLLISCGILGAIMSILRQNRQVGVSQSLMQVGVSQSLIRGASVGFVVFLGVKGGITVFVISNGTDVPFNPYSTAFAGVLAGMFSEKLYSFLSKLVDNALESKGTPKQP